MNLTYVKHALEVLVESSDDPLWRMYIIDHMFMYSACVLDLDRNNIEATCYVNKA